MSTSSTGLIVELTVTETYSEANILCLWRGTFLRLGDRVSFFTGGAAAKIETTPLTQFQVPLDSPRNMNIFVLHPDPRKAARWHADKHVIKMILEAVQMLYTAHWIVAFPFLLQYRAAIKISQVQKGLPVPPSLRSAPLTANGKLSQRLSGSTEGCQRGYRPVHLHHPCTVWVRKSLANYMWLCRLAVELGREKQHRWPGVAHSCEEHARWLMAHPPMLPATPLTHFAVAMPPEYKKHDPIVSYRAFYSGSKTDRGITKSYTRRHKPHWLQASTKKSTDL